MFLVFYSNVNGHMNFDPCFLFLSIIDKYNSTKIFMNVSKKFGKKDPCHYLI